MIIQNKIKNSALETQWKREIGQIEQRTKSPCFKNRKTCQFRVKIKNSEMPRKMW